MLGRTHTTLVRGLSSYAHGPEGGLSALTVGELKQLLSERGVDYRDCLEKSDLAKRLSESAGQSTVLLAHLCHAHAKVLTGSPFCADELAGWATKLVDCR